MNKIINGKEYITVKEFAEAVGYTPQGLYKKINNSLNPLNQLVETVKGIKYLPKSYISVMLGEIVKEKNLNDLNNDLNNLNDNLNDLNNEKPASDEKEKNEITKDIIEMLKSELEIKNKQIEELNNRLAELTETLKREQELNHRQQDLNAKNLLLLENQEQKKNGIFKNLFKKKKYE